ncbi:DMT family transporter [Vitreoscilla stercoraria]|uniref:DMT family transporter n=1 Tax=Vitreoscilla stercoraria TaxID=61 RepID=A0ABY4EDP2_VITST|nr:DMT family transporter [Vitreoscilla stercoraria]UOO92793.1 DMT family transporter [Vitreoscilla stercoraria]
MQWLYLSMALIAGVLLSTQAAVNSQLAKSLLQQPLLAAFISFLIGTLLLFSIVLFKGQLPTLQLLPQQAWWKWTGGLMGAFLVCSSIIVAPKVGVANMLLFIIMGQLCAGLLIDHYGWLNMPLKPIDLSKIMGMGIIILGLLVFFFGHKWLKF